MNELQSTIHIADALREKKVRVSIKGTNSNFGIDIGVERDPSFSSGPLRVIIPAGTCISPEGQILDFPSIVLPYQNSETGRVIYKNGNGKDNSRVEEFIQLRAVCLDWWESPPSEEDGKSYHIVAPDNFPTDLNKALHHLYENSHFQKLEDEEKDNVLQSLVWLVNDKWIGWQSSPYRDLIVDAVQQTGIAAELNYEYVIEIGQETFINSKKLEDFLGHAFFTDMFRIRNHLQAGEMVIIISKSGIISVAHASTERRVITIMGLPTIMGSVLQDYYNELAQKMKNLFLLEVQQDEMIQQLNAAWLSVSTEDDLEDFQSKVEKTKESFDFIEEEFEQAETEFAETYYTYLKEAGLAISNLFRQHQEQAKKNTGSNGKFSSIAKRGLIRLSQNYQGDLDRIEIEDLNIAKFLTPARLFLEIKQKVHTFPSTILVKVSNSLGKIHLQSVYDCLREAGAKGFEKSIQFVILETNEQ